MPAFSGHCSVEAAPRQSAKPLFCDFFQCFMWISTKIRGRIGNLSQNLLDTSGSTP
jgi:hypothetical protein